MQRGKSWSFFLPFSLRFSASSKSGWPAPIRGFLPARLLSRCFAASLLLAALSFFCGGFSCVSGSPSFSPGTACKVAYAYVDYPRTEVYSNSDAAWTFLKDNGFSGSVPDFTSSNQFVQAQLSSPGSPFARFVANYVTLIPAANSYLSAWRVLEASDFDNSDMRETYEHLLGETVDEINEEWDKWVEEYPAAGGGGGSSGGDSTLPSDIPFYIVRTDTLPSSVTFDDGTTYTYSDSVIRAYSAAVEQSGRVFMVGVRSKPSLVMALGASIQSDVLSPSSADMGISFRSRDLASYFGVVDTAVSGTMLYALSTQSGDVLARLIEGNPPWALSYGSINQIVDSDLIGPSDYFYVSSPWDSQTSPIYVICSSSLPVYLYGNWYYGQAGPSPSGPTGPTAPDYEDPEPYEPTDQSNPTIVNNVTNVTHTYTGNETDYSDYLKIIIQNQNEQITQIKAFSDLVKNAWDSYINWLGVEFDEVKGYLANYQQFWALLFDYCKDLAQYLFDLKGIGDAVNVNIGNLTSTVDQWGRLLYEKDFSGGSTENPDIVVTPGEENSYFDWLFDLLGRLFDLLIGSSSQIAGLADDLQSLTGVFPFSIPWDIIAIVGVLVASPVADYVIQWPMLDGATAAGGVTWSLQSVDLSAFSGIFSFIRFGFLGLVAIGLAYKTKDMLDLLGKVVE